MSTATQTARCTGSSATVTTVLAKSIDTTLQTGACPECGKRVFLVGRNNDRVPAHSGRG